MVSLPQINGGEQLKEDIDNLKGSLGMYKIICLGDSITAGCNYTDNRPDDATDTVSWVGYIRRTLGVEIHNKGIGGQTTSQILARFDSDVLANNPTHCIFMGGINDAYKPDQNVSLEQSKANIMEIVARCRANNIVPVIGIFTPTNLCIYGNSSYNTKCDQIRTWTLSYCASNNIAIIDFYSQFLENISGSIITSLLDTDLLHPNVDGYIIMGRWAVYCLKRILVKFTGTSSFIEDFITQYASGQSPRKYWPKGAVVFEGRPGEGNPLMWVCTEAGVPGKWGAAGTVRNINSRPPGRTMFVDTSDVTDHHWETGDWCLYKETSTTINMYEVTKSGWPNSHSVVAERATFVSRGILTIGGSQVSLTNVPHVYQDYYSSPNTSRYYNAGDIVFFTDSPTAGKEAYLACTAGYGNSSPNNPKASWLKIG